MQTEVFLSKKMSVVVVIDPCIERDMNLPFSGDVHPAN
jgi:hypothetical protein